MLFNAEAGNAAIGVAVDDVPMVPAAVGVGRPEGEHVGVAQGCLDLEQGGLVVGVAGRLVLGGRGGAGEEEEEEGDQGMKRGSHCLGAGSDYTSFDLFLVGKTTCMAMAYIMQTPHFNICCKVILFF